MAAFNSPYRDTIVIPINQHRLSSPTQMKTAIKNISAVLLLCVFAAACSNAQETEQMPATSSTNKTPASKPTGELALPSLDQAKTALLKMLELESMSDQTSIKLGTCIAAEQAEHDGQIACGVALTIGAGTSETQADFYLANGEWRAQPSVSQDKLPFPDPKLN